MSTHRFHLLRLYPTTDLHTFRTILHSLPTPPLFAGKVNRWISVPSSPTITDEKWDVLLVYPSTTPPNVPALSSPTSLADGIKGFTEAEWSIHATIPSEILKAYEERKRSVGQNVPAANREWEDLKPSVVAAKGEEAGLKLTAELVDWSLGFTAAGGGRGDGVVSMFNIMVYNPGGKEKYLGYAKAFREELAGVCGGVAVVLGSVLRANDEKGERGGDGVVERWDDVAIVQYPSMKHFVELLASERYKEIDREYKTGAWRDGGILCVSEF